jgi:hypothetical protein
VPSALHAPLLRLMVQPPHSSTLRISSSFLVLSSLAATSARYSQERRRGRIAISNLRSISTRRRARRASARGRRSRSIVARSHRAHPGNDRLHDGPSARRRHRPAPRLKRMTRSRDVIRPRGSGWSALNPAIASAGHEQPHKRCAREEHLEQPLSVVHHRLLSPVACRLGDDRGTARTESGA